MPEIRVQPRSVYEHHIYIQKAHTTLNWTFSTKKKSICFGLYFRKGNPIRFEESPPPVRESFDEGRVKKRNLSLPKISHLRIKVNDDGSREQNTLQTPCPDGDELFPPVDLIKRSSAASPTHTTFSIEASSSSSILARRRKSSAASVNLLDKDFVELIPVDQVHSSKEAICGSYVAEEPGNYILLFGKIHINQYRGDCY